MTVYVYSNCEIDNDVPKDFYSDLYDLILKNTSYAYNQQICFEICFLRQVISTCNCTSTDKYGLYGTVTPCKPKDSCLDNLTKKFLSNEYIKANCLNSCPLQCNRTLYRFTTSSTMLLGDMYFERINSSKSLKQDFVKRPLSIDNIRNSLSRIYIFYDALSYTESIEKANHGSILSLAATIGGILSLFLGVSVLSLFEFIELFIEISFIVKKK